MAKDEQAMQISLSISKILAWPLLLIVRGYQLLVSPLLGQHCRFHPSCSCYAHQALKQHGALKGSWLSIKRIVKCNPMHPGGIDEVPPTNQHKNVINSDRNNTIKNQH
jgi:putative membrane protein insertion efficiency factor